MKLKTISRVLTVTLWVSTLGVALCWLLWENPPFDPEPITVVLGLLSTAVTALLAEYGNRLEEEEFSLPYALAYGYINNFIEPLLTQLLRNASPQAQPRMYIYLPESLAELAPTSIERTLASLRLRSLKDQVVNLEFKEGRARDILTIRSTDNKSIFFDFPNTLLSLNSLIDYKMESRKNKSTEEAREALASAYIRKFREVTESLITKRNMNAYVFFVDKNLNLQFD